MQLHVRLFPLKNRFLQIRDLLFPFPYLGVGDGQAVHRLGCLKQLDLLYHVGLGAENHHPLQPALSCSTQERKSKEDSAHFTSVQFSQTFSSSSSKCSILSLSPHGMHKNMTDSFST